MLITNKWTEQKKKTDRTHNKITKVFVRRGERCNATDQTMRYDAPDQN